MPNKKEELKKETMLGDHQRWHAHLPKAFAYRYRSTPDSILHLAARLVGEMGDVYQYGDVLPQLYHAVTGHPRWREEWLDLWLSKGAADWLVSQDLIPRDSIEETIR